MGATSLGPFAYVVVFLIVISFLLGLYAGYLMKPPVLHLKDKERQQVYTAGYQQGYLDNSDNTKAFQQGFTVGYNEAVVDLGKPRTPQPATAPMAASKPEETEEPTKHDSANHQPQSARSYGEELIRQLNGGLELS